MTPLAALLIFTCLILVGAVVLAWAMLTDAERSSVDRQTMARHNALKRAIGDSNGTEWK